MHFVNDVLDKAAVNELVNRVYRRLGDELTIEMADNIKDLGFKYATRSGITVAVADLTIPEEREEILEGARKRVDQIDRQYRRGLLTEDEQYQRTIEQWTDAKAQVEKAVRAAMAPGSPVTMMALSGSTKGGFGPITQLAGMRGLMADPQGRIISIPITSNFRQGLSALEYFISTHGARKGLADTALRTADAGYLTRRLVDVAQDVIILAEDCGTTKGIMIRRKDNFGKQKLAERLYGRFAAEPIIDQETGEVVIDVGELYTEELADAVDEKAGEEVYVFSPMTCELRLGICSKCYGTDLARGVRVEMGSAVGIIAAQSIGEPGTQLTLRTFHTGGTADARGDITQGLPRVEELFEARQRPKGEAVMSEIGGVIAIRSIESVRHVFVTDSKLVEDEYDIPENWKILLEDQEEVKAGGVIAEMDDDVLTARRAGRAVLNGTGVRVVWESKDERDYGIPAGTRILVSEGERIEAGDQLTEGSKNPHRILEILGRDAVTQYLLLEVQQVYRPQGQNINDKHFETIIRKMLGKVQVTASGDTVMLPGDLVEATIFRDTNIEIEAEGGQPAKAEPVLLGITKASLNTESFLSASSFQHTIKVLAGAAIAGKEDHLLGLKENVIIGKLIPAGTGYLVRQERIAEKKAAEALLEQDVEEVDLSSLLIDDNTDEAVLEKIAAQAAAEAAKAIIQEAEATD
jgi:DNA-directed RNA polymerase subunit beta'